MRFRVTYKVDGETYQRYFFALTFTKLCVFLETNIGGMRVCKIESLRKFPNGVDYLDLM